jgi:hypothetical protein
VREPAARPCHQAGGELEQIQFLLGQIDAVGSEALQRSLNHFPDVLRSAVEKKTAHFIVEAKFGCDV